MKKIHKRIKNMNKKAKVITITGILIVTLPILGLLLFYVANVLMKFVTPQEIKMITHDNSLLEALLVIGIYIVKSIFFFIPIAFIYVITGTLFEPIYAILLNIVGLSACLTMTFYLGRLLGKKRVGRLIEKSQKVKNFMDNPKKSNLTLFILRVSGLFPVELISLVCGCSDYTYLKFIIYSLAAMLPTLISFSIAGTSITNPFSFEFLVPIFIAVIITIVSVIYYKKTQK